VSRTPLSGSVRIRKTTEPYLQISQLKKKENKTLRWFLDTVQLVLSQMCLWLETGAEVDVLTDGCEAFDGLDPEARPASLQRL